MRIVEWNKSSENAHANRTAYQQPFAGLFGQEAFTREHASFVPAANISEESNGYKVELSAPGYDKSDFKIALEKRTLVVSGKHKEEKEVKEQKFSRKEFNYGSFQRSFRLPENANEHAIVATYENGILSLVIPKKEQLQEENREITIS